MWNVLDNLPLDVHGSILLEPEYVSLVMPVDMLGFSFTRLALTVVSTGLRYT